MDTWQSERKHAEEALRQANTDLQAQAEELARFNRAAVNRELRVIELKREINALYERLGERPRYSLDDEPPDEVPAPVHATVQQPEEQGVAQAPLESVLCMEELKRRPSRPPDYEGETRAMAALVQALADAPRTILQTLSDKVVEILGADSAGLSLLASDGRRFYWAAIAGAWSPHRGGGTPRDFGPCGDVLNCNAPMLFSHWERRYPYLSAATPLAEEGLLVPFYVGGKAVGTIWAIAHDARHRFDAEDLRLLESLGHFASAAYQAVESLGEVDQRRAALSLMEDAIEARRNIAESQAQLHELAEERLRLLNELKEIDRRKDEFLATLAHELRNPLAPIRNAVELLRRTGETPGSRLGHDIIDRQVNHLTRLVDDLLDVSRITRNKLELRMERVELAEVVRAAVETSRPFIDENGHELTVRLPDEPVYLNADSVRLAQVFTNLLTNAAKYTERGGSVSLTAERQAGGILVRVKDNGIGIPADKLPHLFGLFFQINPASQQPSGGLGVGLSLVRRLVELHGGTATAHSAGTGQGSEFIVRLPVLAELAHNRPVPQAPNGEKPDRPGRRILVVDDLQDSADSLAMVLRLTGNTVQTAYDGQAAVELAEQFRPEIVLLDIGMPRMNGYDACRHLRRQPWGQNLFLIALTGWGADEDRRRTQEAGFNVHLTKPVQAAALESLLAQMDAK